MKKLVLAVPATAFALISLTAGMSASSDEAAAARLGCGYYGTCSKPPLPPKPDRPNQKRK